MNATELDSGSESDVALAGLLEDVASAQLQPLWLHKKALLTPRPVVATQPWLWSGGLLRSLAEQAGRLVGIDRGGDRRVLSLANPGLAGLPYATRTLWGAVQFLGGGESAPAHRHTPGAIRFVLEGEGVWTLVNGDPCSMSAGDLVLTPKWNWHEHQNPNPEPMMWFDGLDLPMVEFFDAVFFEDGPEEPTASALPARSASEAVYGRAGLRPDGIEAGPEHSPLLAYRWADTDAALAALMERDPRQASVSLTFVDPRSGRDALPTARCQMARLRPGLRTPTTRSVGSTIAVCFAGSGTTVIDGMAFDWQRGDMFVVPSWSAIDHQANEPSDLFMFSDAPVLEALRLARTEQLPAQPTTCRFSPNSPTTGPGKGPVSPPPLAMRR